MFQSREQQKNETSNKYFFPHQEAIRWPAHKKYSRASNIERKKAREHPKSS